MLADPLQDGGGSFTGPIVIGYPAASWDSAFGWEKHIAPFVDQLIEASDELPHHWYMHYMHAAEIIGYKHPDHRIAQFWRGVYERMVHALHLYPETEAQLDERLCDSREAWLARTDASEKARLRA
ncbi:MAG: hypothetical protein WDN46_14055 [Methylocella sp.]